MELGIDILMPELNGRHFVDDFKSIFLNENHFIVIQLLL